MQRTEKILDLLSVHKTMSIHQLSEALFCSPSSLRRDLIQLENTGPIRRIRGGATLVSGTNFDYSASFRETINIAEKNYICNIAQDFLTNGMSIFLDSSSTVSRICPFLENLRNITVLTNGILTALLLNECRNVETFLTGGPLHPGSGSLIGETSATYFNSFQADIAFISCRGMDSDGIYEASSKQAFTKKHIMANAKKTILLIDHHKMNTQYFHRLGYFDTFDAIITDKEPPLDIKQAIEKHSCEILY